MPRSNESRFKMLESLEHRRMFAVAPEMHLFRMDGTEIASDSTTVFDLGAVAQGQSGGGSQMLRVKNTGSAVLNVSTPDVPQGFKVEDLASSIMPGSEDVFVIRIDSAQPARLYQARLAIVNNDPVRGTSANKTFGVNLKGLVNAVRVPAPEISLLKMNGTAIISGSGEVLDLGSLVQGAGGGSMDLKIRNDGDALLTASAMNVPEGFKVEGLAPSIQPGQEDVFTIRIDSTAAPGERSGQLRITNNDADEGTPANTAFMINLKGAIVARKATISGTVFNDANGDNRTSGDSGRAGVTVFLDKDADGNLDGNETSTTTDASGRFRFENLAGGSHRVTVLPGQGWRASSLGKHVRVITLGDGEDRAGVNVALTQRASVSGQVFLDRNKDGIRSSDEPFLSGWSVLLDSNRNGKADEGERVSVTDEQGRWSFNNVAPGKRVFRLLGMGRTPTVRMNPGGPLNLKLSSGEVRTDELFGLKLM